MKKVAVILFNLGGPDSLTAVEPFLFNLFNDKAIISLPQPFRWLLAKFISKKRAPIAQEIYEELGGKSPLLENTNAQARAIEEKLANRYQLKCWPVMRYWHPFSTDVIDEVEKFQPDEVVLLPLYPQFSTTTTGSSLKDWDDCCKTNNLTIKTSTIGCFPTNDEFCQAVADLLSEKLKIFADDEKPRILFSAHGLPQKIIDAGDPYQSHVEKTAAKIISKLDNDDLDWQVCYQSRVGRLEWIKPYTEDAIKVAGADKKALVVVPIAFISEHSETLVELDIEYKELAKDAGVPRYERVATVGTHDKFIDGLSQLIEDALATEKPIITDYEMPDCASKFSKCVCKN